MNYLARIYVTPKPGVVDPQGLSILGGLKNLGYDSVTAVRAGRYLEVHLGEAPSKQDAETRTTEMCRQLLANPVIEDYRFEVTEFPLPEGEG